MNKAFFGDLKYGEERRQRRKSDQKSRKMARKTGLERIMKRSRVHKWIGEGMIEEKTQGGVGKCEHRRSNRVE